MRLGLGQGQGIQHGQGPLPRRVAHIQNGEDGRDVRRMAQGLDLIPTHVHPPAGAAGARFGPGLNAAIRTGAGQGRRQGGKIQPQVDQGGQGHVAADAVAAIQIQIHISTPSAEKRRAARRRRAMTGLCGSPPLVYG